MRLTSLAFLNIRNNQIGDEGARVLSTLTSLTYLNVSFDGISAEGARALMRLTSLTYLDLSGNNIGDEGAQVLSTLTSLTYLDVHNSRISAEGARILMKLPSLTYLDLSENNIGNEGNQILRERVTAYNLRVSFPIKSLYHILLEYAISKNLQCGIVNIQEDSTDPNIFQRCEGSCKQLKTNLQPYLFHLSQRITCKRVCCRGCGEKYRGEPWRFYTTLHDPSFILHDPS